MHQYYEVHISAETQPQADTILNSLLEKKLATGGQFIKTPSRFLWKGEIEEMDYITITSFTTAEKKEALV
ncbi:divalent cation tolerance protein CutA [Candidatus Saccharibacteria bacterium]|nr:divalent cation tolerance protein CutA [Candidatus Saccharibacteria bacterium]